MSAVLSEIALVTSSDSMCGNPSRGLTIRSLICGWKTSASIGFRMKEEND
jgi:hypothetical protein